MADIDYRALLVKYMAHVANYEGDTFVDHLGMNGGPEFSPEEESALRGIEAEIYPLYYECLDLKTGASRGGGRWEHNQPNVLAVRTDNLRPSVTGFGATADEARANAVAERSAWIAELPFGELPSNARHVE